MCQFLRHLPGLLSSNNSVDLSDSAWSVELPFSLQRTHFMHKSILFLAVLLAFSVGCNKSTDLQNRAVDSKNAPEQVLNLSPEELEISNREGSCCCYIVVSSTYFGGISICGVSTGRNACDVFCTTECGTSSGLEKTIPNGKDGTFCVSSGSPYRITNLGILPIRIHFVCPGGASTPVWIDPLASIVYTNDCSGTILECVEMPCKG